MIWNQLLTRQLRVIEGRACREFITGLQAIEHLIQSFPDIENLSEKFEKITNWKLAPVSGLVESEEYFTHLANREFPIANFLRDLDQLDYLAEPDAWHDVFGHLPLLTNPTYSKFVETISQKIILTQGVQRQYLDSLYWYTVEVGVCQENGQRKAYGAALLSSFTEIQDALSEKPKVHPFDWQLVTQSAVKIDEFQNNLFEISSFNFLEELMKQLDRAVLVTC
ncbi:MAG: hypothetical protein JOZ78_26105 [Chroococcidiopsidaceae cyanobacterium CP_BM_ER_R8_30]|nr:hypothetical protein [Chroococcidiopsidaceae cyanobacterium CP_BM_ER_R8_30]